MKKSTCSASVEHSFTPALIGKEPIRIGNWAAEFEATENYPKGHLLCVDRGIYDHVGISDGKGYVYENSYKRYGRGKVSYEEFSGERPIVDLGILQGSCPPDEMLE